MKVGQRVKRAQWSIEDCQARPGSEWERIRSTAPWTTGTVTRLWHPEEDLFGESSVRTVEVLWDDGKAHSIPIRLLEEGVS